MISPKWVAVVLVPARCRHGFILLVDPHLGRPSYVLYEVNVGKVSSIDVGLQVSAKPILSCRLGSGFLLNVRASGGHCPLSYSTADLGPCPQSVREYAP
jgi:hypothetical protein